MLLHLESCSNELSITPAVQCPSCSAISSWTVILHGNITHFQFRFALKSKSCIIFICPKLDLSQNSWSFAFTSYKLPLGITCSQKRGNSSSITINQSLHAQVGNGKFIDYTDLDGASHVLPYINRSYFYSAPFQVELAAGIPAHSDTSHGKSVLLV